MLAPSTRRRPWKLIVKLSMWTSRLCLSLDKTPEAFLSVAKLNFFMSRFSTEVLALMLVIGVPVDEAPPFVEDAVVVVPLEEPSPLAAAFAAFSLREINDGEVSIKSSSLVWFEHSMLTLDAWPLTQKLAAYRAVKSSRKEGKQWPQWRFKIKEEFLIFGWHLKNFLVLVGHVELHFFQFSMWQKLGSLSTLSLSLFSRFSLLRQLQNSIWWDPLWLCSARHRACHWIPRRGTRISIKVQGRVTSWSERELPLPTEIQESNYLTNLEDQEVGIWKHIESTKQECHLTLCLQESWIAKWVLGNSI